MDIEESTFTEEQKGSPGSPSHSKYEKFTSKPYVPDKPITVQELGNMYAEWRMTDEFSTNPEGWLQNRPTLLIPAPKRPFNWKVCCMLVIFSIASIVTVGVAYCVDHYTSFEITSGRRGMTGWKPKHEISTEKIQFDLKLDDYMLEAEHAVKIIEEDQKSREEMMKMNERVQQTLNDQFFRSIKQYEANLNHNLEDKIRELFSRLLKIRRPE